MIILRRTLKPYRYEQTGSNIRASSGKRLWHRRPQESPVGHRPGHGHPRGDP